MLTDMQITPVDTKSRKEIRLNTGDTVRVHQKITEKEKTRIQIFEGIVIARKHGTEAGATFTVRRMGSDGIAVEKIYPLFSPMIDQIEITKRTKTRRAKLYFLREKTQKQIQEKLRRSTIVKEGTTSESKRTKEMTEKQIEEEGEQTITDKKPAEEKVEEPVVMEQEAPEENTETEKQE